MEITTSQFKKTASDAIKNPQIQTNLDGLYQGFHQARLSQAAATSNWDALRDRAKAIKTHTIENLDYYLDMVDKNVRRAGGHVFFANDAKEATEYVVNVAQASGVKMAIKSKSMVSEEMGLNHVLESNGIEPVETDLGEYIVQLSEDTPFHIIAPAIHKSRQEVSDLFTEKLNTPHYEDITDLTREARKQLRDKFISADMGITGANFVIAETGTLVLVTNEGNGRMCTSMPRIHVAITGMEKIVPSMEDMGTFLRLLIRSATGQRLSSYVTTVTGPRSPYEEDGPEEFHLVIVDNGRSRLLADPNLRESLNCLKCGACLNACPVYRKVGGHAYGWVYSGPIGAVISPVLTGVSDGKDLPFASSLCGACREACPVKIDIPRMLLHLRKEISEGGTNNSKPNSTFTERMAMKIWRLVVANSYTLTIATKVAAFIQFPVVKNSRLRFVPPPLTSWTKYRTFPAIASKPFRDRWSQFR